MSNGIVWSHQVGDGPTDKMLFVSLGGLPASVTPVSSRKSFNLQEALNKGETDMETRPKTYSGRAGGR